MTLRRKTMQMLSGFLTAVTLVTTALSPVVTYAAEPGSTDTTIPHYKEIKDLLDADEVVVARDIELAVGTSFDVKADFSGIEIPDESKVKVKFVEAMNDDGQDFSTDHEDSYNAVYYVEPLTTDHPTYQINRTIVVKDIAVEAENTVNSDSSSDHDSGSGETEEESEESESETEAVISMTEEVITETEETESQETENIETEVTPSDEIEDEDVVLGEIEIAETVSNEMPVMFAARASDNTVTVKNGDWYYYADYGLGSYLTSPFYVTWGSLKATAYCVQPSKPGPEDGTYTITKLSDSKTLAKVCYYGTKASDENGFFDEKHPDFSTGKRFVITHIAAAYANGSSDWDKGTNSTGRELAMELYNYCVNMPEIPDPNMSFSDDNVKAYVEGNVQRTKTISFKADELQTITFKLPDGVKLVNVTTGKTSKAGVDVEICGGTQFYLTAPLTQAVPAADGQSLLLHHWHNYRSHG